jgi:hypothetical protein
MTLSQAKKYLARAIKTGYMAYNCGLGVIQETSKRGNYAKFTYGIHINGDGQEGRFFGLKSIWKVEQVKEMFTAKKLKQWKRQLFTRMETITP